MVCGVHAVRGAILHAQHPARPWYVAKSREGRESNCCSRPFGCLRWQAAQHTTDEYAGVVATCRTEHAPKCLLHSQAVIVTQNLNRKHPAPTIRFRTASNVFLSICLERFCRPTVLVRRSKQPSQQPHLLSTPTHRLLFWQLSVAYKRFDLSAHVSATQLHTQHCNHGRCCHQPARAGAGADTHQVHV